MRRLNNLSNSLYHKKFKEIYKLVFTADLDSVDDFSNWIKLEQDIITKATPLWIICESKILNKRIWITQEFGRLGVTTATLNLNAHTSEYNNSFNHNYFKNQKEMVIYLEKLLAPCMGAYNLAEEKYGRVV